MILMHSGIGPRDHLAEMNIDCKVNLPGVGENLIDHPIVCNVELNIFMTLLALPSRLTHRTK